MPDDCIFCRIVAGDLPTVRLYEDEDVLSFLDIRPLRPGHALVVPKAHCVDLRDCPPELGTALLASVQRVAAAVCEATGTAGFNLFNANGQVAGQEVFHLHLHILPRLPGDGFFHSSLAEAIGNAPVVDQEALAGLGERVREALAAATPARSG